MTIKNVFAFRSQPATTPEADTLSVEQFSEKATLCYPALWTLARGLVWTTTDPEDVVQDALLTGFQKRTQYTHGTSFLAWMGTITRYTAMNRNRYEKTRTHHALDEQVPSKAREKEEAVIDVATGQLHDLHDAFSDEIVHALNDLAPIARSCLLLRTVHALEYTMIGEAMGIPTNTALSHVHRARRMLRDQLRPSFISSNQIAKGSGT